ncbi:unnamed protein product [Albugo candida]|uniref:Uncharacterized protein n=1 Tax=Albugo candida TaxID=65357 RepID=A0A024GE01_9STRA|nr:unnamed protein product [Albugo candida]|eukprot:CCI44884.1 unnamed protein product [Albugo candida]
MRRYDSRRLELGSLTPLMTSFECQAVLTECPGDRYAPPLQIIQSIRQQHSLVKSNSLPVLDSKLMRHQQQLEKDLLHLPMQRSVSKLEDLQRSEWRWTQRKAAQEFSKNISKISRNCQRASYRNLQKQQILGRKSIVDTQKLQSSRYISHCRAIAQDRERSKALSTRNQDRLLVESLARMEERIQARQISHNGFQLSKSSSTLFDVDGQTKSLKKRLHSLQLTEYAAEKQKAIRQAQKALAVSHLVEMDIHEDELPTARRKERLSAEMWQAFLDNVEDDFEMLVPFSNSAPAAIRFFGDEQQRAIRLCDNRK